MQATMFAHDGRANKVHAFLHGKRPGERDISGGWIDISDGDGGTLVIHADSLTVLEMIGQAIVDEVAKLREKQQCLNASSPSSVLPAKEVESSSIRSMEQSSSANAVPGNDN